MRGFFWLLWHEKASACVKEFEPGGQNMENPVYKNGT